MAQCGWWFRVPKCGLPSGYSLLSDKEISSKRTSESECLIAKSLRRPLRILLYNPRGLWFGVATADTTRRTKICLRLTVTYGIAYSALPGNHNS